MIAKPMGATHISLKAHKHKHHCYYKILYVEIWVLCKGELTLFCYLLHKRLKRV